MRSSAQTRRTLLASSLAIGVAVAAASCGGDDGGGGPAFTGGTGGTAGDGGPGGDPTVVDAGGGAPAEDAAAGATGGSATTGDSGSNAASDAGPDAAETDGGGTGISVYHCGDGNLETGEDCDDGNRVNGDGCDNNCRFTCVPGPLGDIACSDNILCNGRERCGEDGTCGPALAPAPDNTYCGQNHVCKDGVCTPGTAVCGDGLVIAPEDCEDGRDGDQPGDGNGCDTDCSFTCSTLLGGKTCQVDECQGDVACYEATHTCELAGNGRADYVPCGTGTSGQVCIDQQCTSIYCGNGTLDGTTQRPEVCDDGNRAPGDGCELDCTYTCTASDDSRCEPAGNDVCRASGGCDESDPAAPVCMPLIHKATGTPCGAGGADICISGNCRAIVCGDGVVTAPEECDDRNTASGDGCDAACQYECDQPADCTGAPACMTYSCDNHVCVLEPDPSLNNSACNGGTCSNGACTAGSCGNDTVDGGEQCDRGAQNGQTGSGCTAQCRFECSVNADCDDGDPCNGGALCADVAAGAGKICDRTVAADGTSCGGTAEEVCIDGGCAIAFCGDGFTNSLAGEECDPPLDGACDLTCQAIQQCDLNGSWAMNVVMPVTWPVIELSPGNPVIRAGSGTIVSKVKVDIVQAAGSRTLANTITVCDVQIPDFGTDDTANTFPTMAKETYGLKIPVGVWPGAITPVSVAAQVGGISPGSTYDASAASVQIGLTMDNPFGAWPDLVFGTEVTMPGAVFYDLDGDGPAGVTALAKTTPADGQPANPYPGGSTDYSLVAVNPIPTPLIRSDKLYLIIRQIASQSGVVETCDSISGATSVTAINNHVVGCWDVTNNLPCDALATQLGDGARPVFQPGAATFEMARLTGGTACSDVRAAFP